MRRFDPGPRLQFLNNFDSLPARRGLIHPPSLRPSGKIDSFDVNPPLLVSPTSPVRRDRSLKQKRKSPSTLAAKCPGLNAVIHGAVYAMMSSLMRPSRKDRKATFDKTTQLVSGTASPTPLSRSTPPMSSPRSLRSLEAHFGQGNLVAVARVRITNLRLGLGELRLCQVSDPA